MLHLTLYPRKGVQPTIWNNLTPISGSSLIEGLFRQFDRDPFFENFEKVLGEDFSFNPWVFKDGKYSVEFELPRFRKENIKITIEKNTLHIKAEQDTLKSYQSITIPQDLDVKTLSSTLDHGVLSLNATQKAEAKPLEITIGDHPPRAQITN